MGTADEFNAGAGGETWPQAGMDLEYSIQGRVQILLVASCYRNRDKFCEKSVDSQCHQSSTSITIMIFQTLH